MTSAIFSQVRRYNRLDPVDIMSDGSDASQDSLPVLARASNPPKVVELRGGFTFSTAATRELRLGVTRTTGGAEEWSLPPSSFAFLAPEGVVRGDGGDKGGSRGRVTTPFGLRLAGGRADLLP